MSLRISLPLHIHTSVPDKSKEPESKQFVGLVIGILTTVIVMLLAAIMFIFYRNRRLKAALAPSTFYDQHGDLKVRKFLQTWLTAIYIHMICWMYMHIYV